MNGRVERVIGPAGALAVDDAGAVSARVPVLFVHSLAGNSAHWSAQLAHLRRERRAVALDLRGHGQSEPPRDADYSVEAMAGDVAAVADALDLARFVLVGHSLGGSVALVYAGAHADRLSGLLLVDANGDARKMPAAEAAETEKFMRELDSASYEIVSQGYWSQIAGPDAAVRERLLRDLRKTPRETFVRGFEEVLRFDPTTALARYRGPALAVVTPYNDGPISLHRLGKGLPHRVVAETGHWLHIDRPEEFNRLMDEFLAGLDGGR